MPNQLTYTISRTIRPDDGGTERKINLINRQYTQTDEGFDERKPNVGTSEETFTPSTDITDEGQTYIRNVSEVADNFLLVGNATSSYLLEIPPGEAALLWLKAGVTLYLKFAISADYAEIHIAGR